jgi:hypothetical protein
MLVFTAPTTRNNMVAGVRVSPMALITNNSQLDRLHLHIRRIFFKLYSSSSYAPVQCVAIDQRPVSNRISEFESDCYRWRTDFLLASAGIDDGQRIASVHHS